MGCGFGGLLQVQVRKRLQLKTTQRRGALIKKLKFNEISVLTKLVKLVL